MRWADLQANFDERAAIAQFDGGLARADAEALALGELYERLAATRSLPGVLGELLGAARRLDHPGTAPTLTALGLADMHAPVWGFGHIVPEGTGYRPADTCEPGEAAVIVPAFEAFGLVDLVAESLATRGPHTRLGVAAVLGLDEVERACEHGTPLLVFRDVLGWLRGGRRGVAVVDWRRVAHELDGVPTIACAPSIAGRLHDASRRCRPRPTIITPRSQEAGRVAA